MKYRIAELIVKYSDQPGDLIASVEGLSDSELDRRLGPGKWSIRQQLNHLADCEVNYVHRMKKVVAEDAPLLPAFDSDKWASNLFYDKSSAEDSIALFFTLRTTMAQVLRELNNRDFDRFGIHTEDGKLTLRNLLERAVEHADHHARTIKKIKRKFKIK
jgi:uncharacterized damage-inducible protein DinB